jgi:SAM-dependent methyltransferase
VSAALYDCFQLLAGDRRLRRHLAPHVADLPVCGRALDIGGGTGLGRQGIPCRYICLDVDRARLKHFRRAASGGLALVADAAACPVRTAAVDAVLCIKLLHHLDDGQLAGVLDETARVLKPTGRLVLADAIWRDDRRLGRWWWTLDRGAHPRTAEAIRGSVSRHYVVTHWEELSLGVFHEFVICVARLRS